MEPVNTPRIRNAKWIKSSYSGGNEGNCIEFARDLATHGNVPVRDSKNPEGPALRFEPAAWRSFVTAVKGDDLVAAPHG